MSRFRWTYLDADGTPVRPQMAPASDFPTQTDAESWIGETWRELAEAGVDSVVLWEGEDEIYGPMSLKPMS